MIPQWLQEVQKRHQSKVGALSNFYKNGGGPRVTARDSFHTAPGFRTVGLEFTCVPQAGTPWDPEVIKKLWELDKRYTPLWVRYILKVPADWGTNETILIGRHALGLRVNSPNNDLPDFPCQMPQMPCNGITLEKPNVVHTILQGEAPKGGMECELPGEYQPFNMNLYYSEKSKLDKWHNKSAKEIAREIITTGREAEESYKKLKGLENEYIQKDLLKFTQKKLDQVSELEAKEYLMRKK